MAVTWYWWAAVGASGVQALPRRGPAREDLRREAEQRSAEWRTQRSPSFAAYRFRNATAIVCDALRTHTADEHNRLMRARFTLIVPDTDGTEALGTALAYFADGSAPELENAEGQLRLPDDWERRAPERRLAPAVSSAPTKQVRVAGRDTFAAVVSTLFDDRSALSRSGTGLVCLYSDWLTSGDLARVKAAAVVGSRNLTPGAVPKGAGSRPERAAPGHRRRALAVAAAIGATVVLCLVVALILL